MSLLGQSLARCVTPPQILQLPPCRFHTTYPMMVLSSSNRGAKHVPVCVCVCVCVCIFYIYNNPRHRNMNFPKHKGRCLSYYLENWCTFVHMTYSRTGVYSVNNTKRATKMRTKESSRRDSNYKIQFLIYEEFNPQIYIQWGIFQAVDLSHPTRNQNDW